MSKRLLWAVRSVGVSAFVGVLAVAGAAYAAIPTFSQTSVTVGVGQSTSLTAENGVGVYVASNPASNIVSTSVNGAEVTLIGLAPGSSNLSICGIGTASDCTNLEVTVQVGGVSSLTFSENNLSLSPGGTQTVTISGGNGTYSISGNSNTAVDSANLSGNSLTISGVAAGSATVNVCDGTGTNCGALSITVGSSSSGLTFSENNLSLSPGGTQTVTISGGNGTYSISSNSNSSAVSVGLSGSTGLVVDGIASGSATITICDTSGTNTCGTLSVTVTGSTSTSSSGPVSFSITNPTITVGQQVNITLSGGATTYVVLTNTNSSIAQASMTGSNVLSLTGLSVGTDPLAICAIAGGCSPLSVTVIAPTSTVAAVPVPVPVATAPAAVPAGVVTNSSLLAEIQALQTAVTETLSQLESIQTQLNQVEAQVNAGSGSGISTNAGDFTELLSLGSEDVQVTALQQRLASLGFYSGPVTGYYGALTEQAVMKYQTAHGIEATGELGPLTRTALNAGE